MATARSYHDRCPIARALDVVGERWALLLVRELLLGPQRFSELRRGLPGASTNMLTDRLRELEARGVIHRRVLPPPAASSVYELTERGRALEPVLDALGAWGASEPAPADGSLSPAAVLLFLRGHLASRRDPPAGVWGVSLHGQPWTLVGRNGALHVLPGEPQRPDAVLSTDPETLNALLLGQLALSDAVRRGRARVCGDVGSLRWLAAGP